MRLAFSRFGEGNERNIVILHGLLGSKRNWFSIGKSLSDLGFNVWLVDLRNHGESEWSDKHTYFDLAEDVKKLLEEHGEGSKIEFSKDPSIMGGLSIKIGDETLDLSIRGKVKKLVNQLNF